MRSWRMWYAAVALITLTAYLTSCVDEGGSGSGGQLGAAEVESYLRTNVASSSAVMLDGVNRVVQTVAGNPQPGVNIVPTSSGGTGSVGMDFDGNGSNETSVDGAVTFNDPQLGLAGGAQVGINAINSPNVNGSGSAQMFATPSQVGLSAFSPGGAPTSAFSDGTTTTEIYDFDMVADISAGAGLTAASLLQNSTLSGYMSFRLVRGDVEIDAEAYFIPLEGGGFQIQVMDEETGIDFTIP